MLPTPLISDWSSRARLIVDRLRRSARWKASSSKSGSSGSRAMCAMTSGRPSGVLSWSDRPPKVRWSTKRSSVSRASVKRARMRRCFSSGAACGCTSSWPLMPRWARIDWSVSSRGSHRYLPRRLGVPMRWPFRRSAKSSPPARWRRTARGCSTSTSATVRWATHRSRPRRTTSTSGNSGMGSPVYEPSARPRAGAGARVRCFCSVRRMPARGRCSRRRPAGRPPPWRARPPRPGWTSRRTRRPAAPPPSCCGRCRCRTRRLRRGRQQ